MTFLLILLGTVALVVVLAWALAAPDGPRCHYNPKPPGLRRPKPALTGKPIRIGP